jgi:CheY-like chemotaxis protein
MTPEVLVVDDNSKAAENYANLIETRAKVGAIATSDVNKAVELVRKYQIKVAVLDQKMPDMQGTTLFLKLREVDQNFRAVMLTGEADGPEIGEALTLGYSDYLHKSKVADLPSVILNELAKFHLTQAQKEAGAKPNLIMCMKNRYILNPTITNVYLISTIVIDEEYVPESEWRTILQLKAGESQKFTDTISLSQKITLDSGSEQKLVGSLSSGKQLSHLISAKIEAYVLEKYSVGTSRTEKIERIVEKDYSLPKEPEKPDANYIVSRTYQRAQVYRKIQAFLRITCSCCGRDELTSVIVMQPTGQIATRHLEHLLRGDSRAIPTGVAKY